MLEVLVHLQPLFTPSNFCLAEIRVPDDSILTLDIETLPPNWNDISPPAVLKEIGNQFIKEGKYLMMKVPSSVVYEESNYLINPMHPDIKKVSIVNTNPFNFDRRLL